MPCKGLKTKRSYQLGSKDSESDRVLNDLVAQWAGKDLQPWLAQTGKDYPELKSYQLGALPSGPSRAGGAGRRGFAPTPTAVAPTAITPQADVTRPLQDIVGQMQERYGEFQTWLAGQREDVEGAAGRAGADVAGQAEIARQSEARRVMGLGIDPTSGRFGALSRRSALDEARARAAAMTRARGTERERATGLRLAGEERLTGMLGQMGGVAGEISGLRELGAGRGWESREAELARQGLYGEAGRLRTWEAEQATLGREEAEVGRGWEAEQAELGRQEAAEEAERLRAWRAEQTRLGQEYETGFREAEWAREDEPLEEELWGERPGPGGSYYWSRMKKGGLVSPTSTRRQIPNVYKVGEGGTKKRPRPELYISDKGGVEEVGKRGPETISVREEGLIIPNPKTMKEMGKRKKGLGYFGELKRPDGMISTELSVGVNIDGKEIQIPSLVPTLTQKEINYLLGGNEPTKQIINKAVEHAKKRIAAGKNPFAQTGEAISKKPRVEGIETRQYGGRVSSKRARRTRRIDQILHAIPENILQAIGTIKGSYDADVIARLEGIGQTRARGPGARSVPIGDLLDPHKGIREKERMKQSKLMEVARYYGLRPGMAELIPAIPQPYRKRRITLSPESSRKAMTRQTERKLAQEERDFDPNFLRTMERRYPKLSAQYKRESESLRRG